MTSGDILQAHGQCAGIKAKKVQIDCHDGVSDGDRLPAQTTQIQRCGPTRMYIQCTLEADALTFCTVFVHQC